MVIIIWALSTIITNVNVIVIISTTLFFCLLNVYPMQGCDDIHLQHFVTNCLVGHCFHVLGTKTIKIDNERINLSLNPKYEIKEPRQ